MMQRTFSRFLHKCRSHNLLQYLLPLQLIGKAGAKRRQSLLLWTARILWSIAILAVLAEALVQFPWLFVQYQQVCAGSFCGLTSLEVQELQSLYIPVIWYIVYQIVLACLLSGVWFALGIALFWQTRRRRDTGVLVAWAVSLVLVAYAVNIVEPSSPRLPTALVIWVRVFGETFLFLLLYWYWRIAHRQQRTQTRAIIRAMIIANAMILLTRVLLVKLPHHVLLVIVLNTLFTLAMLLVPFALGRAIVRYRFWEIHTLLNRTLTYGALTVCVLGAYIVIVGGLGMLIQRPNNPLLSLLATGTIAALFQPLRARLQTLINRLLYGEWDNPSAVLGRLGQQLETTLAPEAVPLVIVSTLAQTLKLPAATLLLNEGKALVEVARYGDENVPWALTLPLISQGERLGMLCLAARAPGESFSSVEVKMLGEVARQASIAVLAGRATRDLQRARERLVTAREEERRRLQRDLHDGFGPTLASFPQRIDTACQFVSSDPQEAIVQLQSLKKQVRAGLAEMRRMIYALRPPILEEWGLLAAIREQIIPAVRQAQIQVMADLPQELPSLSAAVEVAVYRIIQEALANVVRHARAHSCSLCLFTTPSGLLIIEIGDDGVGMPSPIVLGVGIRSMRERVAELGGTCLIAASATGGTRISVRIPFPKEVSCNGHNSSRDCR